MVTYDQLLKSNAAYNKSILKGRLENFKFPDKNSYKLGIESSDIEILAEAISVEKKVDKIGYVAAIDYHFVSKWATKMLEDNYEIRGFAPYKPYARAVPSAAS